MIKSFITKTRWLVTIILLLSLSVGQMWAGTDFKTEKFEDQDAESTYNETRTYTANKSNAGIAWFVEHGCVSATNKLNDNYSMHMRAYYAKNSASGTWNGNLPYLESRTDVKGLVSITFDAAVSNTYLHMDVMYSTNSGSTWNYMYKTSASSGTNASNITFSGTSKTTGTYYIPSAALSPTGDYRIKIAIYSGSTHSNKPGSAGNYTFRVDDVKFTYTAYSVTYDGNGKTSGSVPTDATKYLSGATVTVKGNTGSLAKTGYEFGGWNTNASGTGSNYTAGSGTFTISDDITLYAKWTATASCTSNASIGNASLNGTFTLSSIPLQCSVSSEGGTGCSITDAGFVWKSGGTDPSISDNKTSGTYSTNITGTIPSAGSFTLGTTYKIKAYATNGNGDALSSSSFTLIPRAVIFHKNDGSATTSTQYVNDGVATALTANSFSRTGYTFNGWNTDADGTSGNNYADQANVTASSGNVDLYAKWTEKPKYTITLNAGNGTVSADGWTAGDSPTWSKTQANGDEAITFPEASCNCAGWNFVGWATSSASNAGSDPTSKTAGSTLTPASDVTYYAVYQQSTPGGTTYNKITSTGDLTTGEYVFASSSGYAMSKTVVNDRMSEKGSSYTGTSVTVSADTLRWLVVKFGSQVLIRNKNNSKFLGIDKDGYITCDDNPHLWTFTYNTTNSRWEFTSATYTSYQLIYNSYFKAGTTQSTAIYLYKQGAVTGNYYTSPSCSDYTVTASASPVAGGTVYQSTTSVTSGSKIYVYCTIHKDYNFGGWTISGTGVSPTSASTQFVEITAGSANVTATASYERKDWHVQWKVNGVELSGSDLGDAQNYYDDDEWAKVLPPNPSSCDTGDGASDVFVGWTTNTWGGKSTEPAVLFKNGRDAPYINADVTYHAVFAKESSTTYKRITSTKYIGLDSKIVIVNNSSEKALKNDYSAVDVSSNLSADDATLSSVSSDWVWTAKSQDSDGYYILKNGSKQLGINKTGGMTSSYSACGDYSTVASAWDVWEASDDSEFNTTTSNCFYLWNWATTTYYNFLTLYNSTTWESKYYANSSSKGSPTATENAMRLYIPEYTNYLISCCTEHDITLTDDGDVTGGTFETDPTSACEGAEVTLSATPSDGYVFAGWTVTKTASPYTDITSTNVDGNTLTMPDYGVTVNASFATLTGITVKTAPTKTTYCEGDNFDPTGLVITASFSNSTTLDIPYSGNEAKFTFSPTTAASLTTGNTSVTITYSGQSTSQAITVNSKLAVTRAGTPAGTVTGGTFTVDNATACVGTTINIEAEAASHYTFGSWTITKTSDGTNVTGSVSIGSATSASTSFTMPAYAVTVTATFNENAYHTATFKNNGVAVSGYDAVKTYDGERPSAPTLTDITDACDKTDCNKFYGWIAEAGIWPKTINSVAGKTIYRRAADIPNVSGADVVYHAVWAKGTATPEISSTLIAKWDKQSLTASTAIKAKDPSGSDINTITLTPNFSTNQTSGIYCCNSSGVSVYPTITISGLDFSEYDYGGICFYTRTSTNAVLTIKTSSGGDYANLTTFTTAGKEHPCSITNIPKNTTSIQIVSANNSGSFYFGFTRIYGVKSTPTYNFTELTAENTSGWTGADWDGYYLITFNSSAKAVRSDGIEGWYGLTNVTPSEGVITTSDIGLIFKATYSAGNSGYAVQGLASQCYINTAKRGEAYHLLNESAAYISSIAYNQLLLSDGKAFRWNSDRAGEYGPAYGGAPTLYKIMSTFTEFRITCCDKGITIGTPTKTGSGSVTFASGGDDYAVGDKVETCEGETTIMATVTPNPGHQCTALSFSRADGEDIVIDVDPATAVPFTAATDFEITVEKDANTTLNTTVTFVALHDYYIDNMHYNTTKDKSGNYGTAPTLSNETKGEECTGLHYKFVGWIPESDMDMDTGVPTTTANMVAGGATGKYATGTNYYAVWAEEN